jgi:phytoene synthase
MNKVAQDILKKHAKSFYFAGLLLDRKTLNDAAILYAFCRQLDDAADQEDQQDQLGYLIADYKKEVPDDLINKEFRKLQNTYQLEQKFIDDLIIGISSDINFTQPKDLSDLIRYSYQVAGTVGALMAKILGANHDHAWKFAIDLGIGMQITNISRDIKEDAENGRIYIPENMLPHNFKAQDITNGSNDELILNVTKQLLDIAEKYYQSGFDGIYYIPKKNKFSILIAGILYNSIGKKIIRNKTLFLKQRIYLNSFEKLLILIVNFFTKNKKYKSTEPVHLTNQLHSNYF